MRQHEPSRPRGDAVGSCRGRNATLRKRQLALQRAALPAIGSCLQRKLVALRATKGRNKYVWGEKGVGAAVGGLGRT